MRTAGLFSSVRKLAGRPSSPRWWTRRHKRPARSCRARPADFKTPPRRRRATFPRCSPCRAGPIRSRRRRKGPCAWPGCNFAANGPVASESIPTGCLAPAQRPSSGKDGLSSTSAKTSKPVLKSPLNTSAVKPKLLLPPKLSMLPPTDSMAVAICSALRGAGALQQHFGGKLGQAVVAPRFRPARRLERPRASRRRAGDGPP
jgi:hypothetical protein